MIVSYYINWLKTSWTYCTNNVLLASEFWNWHDRCPIYAVWNAGRILNPTTSVVWGVHADPPCSAASRGSPPRRGKCLYKHQESKRREEKRKSPRCRGIVHNIKSCMVREGGGGGFLGVKGCLVRKAIWRWRWEKGKLTHNGANCRLERAFFGARFPVAYVIVGREINSKGGGTD